MFFEFWVTGVALFVLSVALMIVFFGVHHITRPNVISVMYISHVSLQLAASIVLIFKPWATEALQFFMLCSVSALLIPIGGMMGALIVPLSNTRRRQFRSGPLSDALMVRIKMWKFFIAYLTICGILFGLYISNVGASPLFGAVAGQIDAANLASARSNAGAGNLGLMYGISLRFLMPVLFVLGLLGLGYFQAVLAKVASLLAIGIAFCFNAWAMDKTPVAMLFMVALFALVLKKEYAGKAIWLTELGWSQIKGKIYGRKRKFYVGCVLLTVLMFSYPVWIFLFKPAGQQGVAYIVEHVFLRIAWKPAVNAYMSIEAFPSVIPYTYFSDIYKLTQATGWEYLDLSKEISVYKGQSELSNAPPPAIGNFYAQGGWLVVVIGVLFASATFKIVENVLCRAQLKTILHTALYALLLFGAFRFSWANFHTILATEVIFPLVLMLGAWRVFGQCSCLTGGISSKK